MFLQNIWLVILSIVVIWYLIVTMIVAKKGFTSLMEMLRELEDPKS
jgi:hypothetical protein